MEGKTAKEKKSFKDDYMRLRHAIDKVLSHTMVSLENQVSLSRGGEQQGRLYSLIKITIHGYDPSQQRGQSILTKVGHKASLTVRFKLIWSHWVASVLMARAFIDRNCRQAIVIQVFYWFVNWQKWKDTTGQRIAAIWKIWDWLYKTSFDVPQCSFLQQMGYNEEAVLAGIRVRSKVADVWHVLAVWRVWHWGSTANVRRVVLFVLNRS